MTTFHANARMPFRLKTEVGSTISTLQITGTVSMAGFTSVSAKVHAPSGWTKILVNGSVFGIPYYRNT